MEQPLISVVIPVYNEERRIKRALESIVNQTYRNLEIIIVDDFSTDKSAAIAKEFAAKDPRVTYHAYPFKEGQRTNWRGYDINAGCLARAYGFSLAKGEWITTQDADDASLLNRIEVQYDLAVKYGATMLTVEWQQPNERAIGKKLDIARLFKEKSEEYFLIRPEQITPIPAENLGLLMRLPFHHLIPFPIKWFPYTRPLFYGKRTVFPGADNCMLFRREVIEKGVNFRTRDRRQWGVPSGRGSGRDFVMHVTHVFKNTWSFKLPLYLWDVRTPHTSVPSYPDYLID
jgi:glycosyltransferase involved in cell wall biosynthesis